jgi:superoxide dismutase, Fe-Mn family
VRLGRIAAVRPFVERAPVFKLPPLPYPPESLAPTISSATMETHHGKHHAKYVETTNSLLLARGASPNSLEAVVREAAADADPKLFNNAAQAWNHAFFWSCMTPRSTRPAGPILRAIDAMFDGLDGLKEAFISEGVAHFGSGWAWLTSEGGALSIRTTHDADTALVRPETPLLVCDLWEHAYYLDYRNERARYLATWWDNVVNWNFVVAQYDAARGGRRPWRYMDAQMSSENQFC